MAQPSFRPKTWIKADWIVTWLQCLQLLKLRTNNLRSPDMQIAQTIGHWTKALIKLLHQSQNSCCIDIVAVFSALRYLGCFHLLRSDSDLFTLRCCWQILERENHTGTKFAQQKKRQQDKFCESLTNVSQFLGRAANICRSSIQRCCRTAIN